MFTTLTISFSLLINVFTVSAIKPEVKTTHGKVIGKVFKSLLLEKEYYGFMGIPYAAPPVNELRFLPPRSVDPWDDILPATKEKQPCVQYNNNIKKGQPLGQFGVEDCLYLDIYTPNLNNNLPVVLFLYNEYFSNSYNKTKDYAPDFFIESDVILATISHRLSAFGFLSFEDDVLSGNSGLKDIVAVLEWIRNNIERFGGDSKRITLLGSQGGAAAADLLIHSKARGLFNAVILQGGTSFSSLYLKDDVRERAFKLGEVLERRSSNSHQLLRDLSEIPSGDLLEYELEAIPKDFSKENQRGLLAFGPVVETDSNGLLTDYPEHSKEIDVPVMIGFNSREGLDKSLQYLIEPNYVGSVNKDFTLLIPRRVNFTFDLDNTYDQAIKDITRFYFTKSKLTIHNIPEYVTYMGDILAAAIDYTAEFYSRISSSNVYYYHFDYSSELNENKINLLKLSKVQDGTFGAASGDELCYLFKCPTLKQKYLKYNKSMSEEIMVQRNMIKLWTNFVKYGNPSPDNDEENHEVGMKWPPYNSESKQYLHIGRNMEIRQDLYESRFEFWETFIKKWQAKAVDGRVSESRNNKDEL